MTSESTIPSTHDSSPTLDGGTSSQVDTKVDRSPPLPVLSPGTIVGGRYRISALLATKGETQRYRGVDLESGSETLLPVVVACQPAAAPADAQPCWTDIQWEQRVLHRA